jgi:hypothetical protein
MKSAGAKCIHVILALLILASAVAPACAGSENCSMPCCRHKAKPVSHQTDAAHDKPCCPPTADAAVDIGSGCRFDQHKLALPSSGSEVGPIIAAAIAATVPENQRRSTAWTPAARCVDSSLPDTPLYLRLQTLLI